LTLSRSLLFGAVFTVLMLVFLASGLVTGILELFLWAAALIIGWVWLLRKGGPRGTR
jgi:hypothetical protein